MKRYSVYIKGNGDNKCFYCSSMDTIKAAKIYVSVYSRLFEGVYVIFDNLLSDWV